MAFDLHKNFAYSTVATAPSPASSGTSLTIQTGDGTKFPTVPFNATVWPVSAKPSTTNAEIVRVTNIAVDTFTITRTQENTSARSIVIGDQIAATETVKTFTDIEERLWPIVTKTGNYTLQVSDDVVFADSTGGIFTLTLPDATTMSGKEYQIKKTSNDSNIITLATTSSQTIDGSLTQSLAIQYDSVSLISNGANWFIV